MNKKTNPQKTKYKLSKELVLVIVIIIVIILDLAGLTKSGYIQNYFNIPFLTYEKRIPAEVKKIPEKEKIDWGHCLPGNMCKPLIYLYPAEKQEIEVKVDFHGELTESYPDYNDGWKVIAYPDGKIINLSDHKTYNNLFWEARPQNPINWDMSSGFVVKGTDTKDFLQDILKQQGLIASEINDFVEYWYRQMENNKYNLIHFADKQYTDTAHLLIKPKPDSVLRIFMVYKSLEEPIKVTAQEIKPFNRNGFSVIEWGGTVIK